MGTDKIRSILNILFLIGAVASVILYYACEDKTVFFYVCGCSLFIKIMEYVYRFLIR